MRESETKWRCRAFYAYMIQEPQPLHSKVKVGEVGAPQ